MMPEEATPGRVYAHDSRVILKDILRKQNPFTDISSYNLSFDETNFSFDETNFSKKDLIDLLNSVFDLGDDINFQTFDVTYVVTINGHATIDVSKMNNGSDVKKYFSDHADEFIADMLDSSSEEEAGNTKNNSLQIVDIEIPSIFHISE